MAKNRIIVTVCDKCGTESNDPTKFLNVTVREVLLAEGKNQKARVITSRDLCIESCVGLPGVNRDAS